MSWIIIFTVVLSVLCFFIVVVLCIANAFGLLKTHVQRPEVKKMFKISVVTLLIAVAGFVTASFRYLTFSAKPYLGFMNSITNIQRALEKEGLLQGSPDNVLGPNTFTAIREFQKANGLRESKGAIDQETVDKLFDWRSRASSPINKENQAHMQDYLQKPSFSRMREKAQWLQSVLCRAGCYDEKKKDGILRPELLEAVRDYQCKKGINPDGIFGPDTLLCAVEDDINRFSLDFVSERLKKIKK